MSCDVYVQTPDNETFARLEWAEIFVWLERVLYLYAFIPELELVAALPDTDHVVTSITVPA